MIIGNDQIISWAVFDGTNDYLARGADLTGNADSKVMTLSCWFTLGDTSGAARALIGNTNTNRFFFDVSTSGIIDIRARDGVGNIPYDLYSSIAVDDGQIHHIMASANAATGAKHMYIDGVDRLDGVSTTSDFTVDYTTPDWLVGALEGGLERWNGKIGQLYFNNAAYVDLSSEANRIKFWNYGPVSMGSDGSTPTGTAPRIYLNNAFGTFQTNLGTGGNFTVTGTLTDGGTYP